LKKHVVITTYDLILRDTDAFEKTDWETVIVDEGHRLKSRQTKLYQILSGFRRVWWKLLLTGTPMQNNMAECLNLLHFLDPHKFSNIEALTQKYSDITRDHVDELHDLLRPFILRRTKSEVLADKIPDKIDVLVPTQMTSLQRDMYKHILEKNFAVLKSLGSSRLANKTSLNNVVIEIRKLLNHPYLVQGGLPNEVEESTPEEQHRILIESCGKLIMLYHMLKRLQERGRRVLIFSTMTRTLDILEVRSRQWRMII
jgi:SNF2 family DNA or RNA helicase